MSNKYAYITVLSNDLYLPGVKGLYRSLLQVGIKYPFYLIIGKDVSEDCINELKKIFRPCDGIIRRLSSINLPKELVAANVDSQNQRWNYTFEKLFIFEQDQFDKLCFLDSDMFVLQNLDHLFQKEHMSATNAGVSYPGNEKWGELNSGILVIKPQRGLLEEFLTVLPQVMQKKRIFGDQDVLQFYYKEWKNNPYLNIGEKYNIFADYASYYIINLSYNFNSSIDDEKSIAVIHYAGESKPWMNKYSILKEFFIKCYLLLAKIFNVKSLTRYRIEYYLLSQK